MIIGFSPWTKSLRSEDGESYRASLVHHHRRRSPLLLLFPYLAAWNILLVLPRPRSSCPRNVFPRFIFIFRCIPFVAVTAPPYYEVLDSDERIMRSEPPCYPNLLSGHPPPLISRVANCPSPQIPTIVNPFPVLVYTPASQRSKRDDRGGDLFRQ